MKIDIHRHAADKGSADKVVRNLFHNQSDEINSDDLYSIGLHPWHVTEGTLLPDIEQVSRASAEDRIIAVGETGLDKTIAAPLDIQKKAFEMQIEIAGRSDKPMIIHCVRAYQEIIHYRMVSKHKYPWIIHWFNASREMGEQLIDKGFYLSFGHMLFNETSKVFRAFPFFPVDRIFFETDDAGFTIDEIYRRASQLLNMEPEKLESQIISNFYNCFKIKL